MKRILPLLLFLAANSFFAQTLTQVYNEPKVGDLNLNVNLDTTGYTTGLPLSLTGPGSNWNFNKLKTASDNFNTHFEAPATVTSSSSYPGTTVVQNDSGFFTFIKSVTTPTTRTEVLGFISPGFAATFTNSAIAAVYPITSGSTFSDNIAGGITFSTTNLTCQGKISYTADGTGTLTLADGFVYNNVLRLKSVQTLTASLLIIPFATIVRTTYEYYDASEKFPVLTIEYQSLTLSGGTPSVTGVVSGNSKCFTGIANNGPRESRLEFYPNPASGQVNLQIPAELTTPCILSIYSVTGSKALEAKGLPQDLRTTDVSSLTPGCYTMELRYAGGDLPRPGTGPVGLTTIY